MYGRLLNDLASGETLVERMKELKKWIERFKTE